MPSFASRRRRRRSLFFAPSVCRSGIRNAYACVRVVFMCARVDTQRRNLGATRDFD